MAPLGPGSALGGEADELVVGTCKADHGVDGLLVVEVPGHHTGDVRNRGPFGPFVPIKKKRDWLKSTAGLPLPQRARQTLKKGGRSLDRQGMFRGPAKKSCGLQNSCRASTSSLPLRVGGDPRKKKP